MKQAQFDLMTPEMKDSISSVLPLSEDLLQRMALVRANMAKITGREGCRLEKLSIEVSVTWSCGSRETPLKTTSRMLLGEFSQ
jgi:hypothetical protein